jgi:hypothetical protein
MTGSRHLNVYRFFDGVHDFVCAARSKDAVARLMNVNRTYLEKHAGIRESTIEEERAIALSRPGHVFYRNGNGWSPWRG